MAYSLKASGIATNLVLCLAVDQDGTTIKEFVSSDVDANKVVHANVTRGTSTWKGVSRSWFRTANGGGNVENVDFPSGHRPVWDVRGPGAGAFDGGAIFMAVAGSEITNTSWVYDDVGIGVLGRASGAAITMNGAGRIGSTSPPSDGTTKWSAGGNYAAFTDWQIYYGLESGSLAQDATGSDAGTATTLNITGVGGWVGFATSQPVKFHLVALFNRTLTLGEMQSLHDDWFGTLFDAGGGATSYPARRSFPFSILQH